MTGLLTGTPPILALLLAAALIVYLIVETWSSVRKHLNQRVGRGLTSQLPLRAALYPEVAFQEFRKVAFTDNLQSQENQFRLFKILDELYLYTTVESEVFEAFSRKLKSELNLIQISDQTRLVLVNILESWRSKIDLRSAELVQSIGQRKYLGNKARTFSALESLIIQWRGRQSLAHSRQLIAYRLKNTLQMTS